MEGYCFNCMFPVNNTDVCPHCGYDGSCENFTHRLPAGTVLKDRFLIGNAIGEGGFGITYIGRDLTLDMRVAVKEYYPNGYVNRNNTVSACLTATGTVNSALFDKGKSRFINEAKSLARFSGENGIVDVRDYFEENNTAYIVMEYLDGKTLKVWLKENGVFDANDIFRLMEPVFDSLEKIHGMGIIHRDISPDNIMMLKNGLLKIMDFGSARDFDTEEPKSLSIMLKPGYAPEEQYRSKGNQGPWTDVYALCATIYKCITGKTPLDALDRVNNDELLPPSAYGIAIDSVKEAALMKGLAVRAENRPKSVSEFKAMLNVPLQNQMPVMTAASAAVGEFGVTQMPQATVLPNVTIQPNTTVQPYVTEQHGSNDSLLTKGSLGALFVGGTNQNTETESSGNFSTPLPQNGTPVMTMKKGMSGAKKTAVFALIIAVGIGILYAVSSNHSVRTGGMDSSIAESSRESPVSSKDSSKISSENSSKIEPTVDWTTFTFKLEGKEYTLPFDFDELKANGWDFDFTYSDYNKDYILNPNDDTLCALPIEKDDYENFYGMYTGITNLGDKACKITEGKVFAMTMDIFLVDSGEKRPDIELPGGITWGSDLEEVTAAYGTPDSTYRSDELGYNSYTYYQEKTSNTMAITVYDDSGLTEVSLYVYEP